MKLWIFFFLMVPGLSLAQSEPVRGVTRCAADLQLSFSLAGRIAQTLVKEGSTVRRGTVLMHLEKTAEELDVQRRFVQWQGQADILVAQARFETAQKQLEAARSIYSENRGISLEELQNRELALRTTLAELERVKTLKETERLDYLTAKENLQRRTLFASAPGIVTRLIKQTGESAQAYEAVLRLCDLRRIEFVAHIPADTMDRLDNVTTIKIQIAELEKPIEARLTFLSPVVDAASGLRELKAELINPPPQVRPGVGARLLLP